MARRGGRSSYYKTAHYPGRDTSVIATTRFVPRVFLTPTVLPVRSMPSVAPRSPLRDILYDRRVYAPDRTIRPPGGSPARQSRLRVSRFNPARVQFGDPQRLRLCQRRNERRRVLHAKGVAGSKGLRRYRRNEWSDVSC